MEFNIALNWSQFSLATRYPPTVNRHPWKRPAVTATILFRHRIEVLREIALRLRELSVLPPFRANATVFMSSEHFQQ